MKKSPILYIVLFALFACSLHAQTWSGLTPGDIYYTSGNVGIGTSSPGSKLTVADSAAVASIGSSLDYSVATTNIFAKLLFKSHYNIRNTGQIYIQGNNGNYTSDMHFALDPNNGTPADVMVLKSNGNVGIGNSSPGAKLHIGLIPGGFIAPVTYSSGNGDGLLLNNYGINDGLYTRKTDIVANSGDNSTEGRLGIFTKAAGSDPTEKLTILGSGNVGIGTTSPDEKLQIQGGSVLVKTIRASTNSVFPLVYGTQHVNGISGYAGVYLLEDGSGGFGQASGLTFKTSINDSSPLSRLTIRSNGNVGIGTISPDELLAVNGTIHSQEVRVDLTGWEDKVFKRSYKLSTLSALKTYIDLNHHLPDMPSESELMKTGLNLGNMEKILTKKVEELTLYLIDQQKQIALLKARLQTSPSKKHKSNHY